MTASVSHVSTENAPVVNSKRRVASIDSGANLDSLLLGASNLHGQGGFHIEDRGSGNLQESCVSKLSLKRLGHPPYILADQTKGLAAYMC